MVWSRRVQRRRPSRDPVSLRHYPLHIPRKLRDRRPGVSTSAAARAGVQPDVRAACHRAPSASVVRRALVHAPGCYGRLGLRRLPRAGGGYVSVLRLAWGGWGGGGGRWRSAVSSPPRRSEPSPPCGGGGL